MPKRPYDLPPMGALVAFEAAARHVSFKAAARELNVTPAAISHHVKALETELRTALFDRHHRGVELTATGAYLLVAVQRGFEAMGDAVDQLRKRAHHASVTIRATTAVSSLWLTPKLAQFWKTHDQVSVAQMVSDTGEDRTDCDLSVNYGPMPRDTSHCRLLFRDRIMALGSPRFARMHRISCVADLAQAPLIHFESNITGWTDWREWFGALGYRAAISQSHRVNNYLIALQAARDDMGAALGWVGLTRAYLDSRELVPLLPARMDTTDDFYVRIHPQASDRARLVYEWLSTAG